MVRRLHKLQMSLRPGGTDSKAPFQVQQILPLCCLLKPAVAGRVASCVRLKLGYLSRGGLSHDTRRGTLLVGQMHAYTG